MSRRKLRFYDMLVDIGFKEIEVGFPSASQTDFDFVRKLIDGGPHPRGRDDPGADAGARRPDRAHLRVPGGARRAIVHLYNATAPVFRRVVFGMDAARDRRARRRRRDRDAAGEPEAQPGTRLDASSIRRRPSRCTEPDFALEICEARDRCLAADAGAPGDPQPADDGRGGDAERLCRPDRVVLPQHLARRDAVIISLHPHNDRGTAVAAAELALLAGADRVEGCLFGNGERTGNVDLVTLALNLYTQGVDPGLRLPGIREVVRTVDVLQPPARASAPSLCGRTGLHRLLGLAPGCDQEGLRRPCAPQRRRLGDALPAHRPRRSRARATRR